MNAITRHELPPPPSLVPQNLNDALRLAEAMAQARTVPKHLQASPGDCLMVVEQAMRWGMSPFAVAQATSVISGKLMFEGKLVAAAVETSGAITGHMDYSFTGAGDTRTVTVSATRRGETNPRTVSVAFKDARTANEMWKRQPDQQLVYHGARVWARRWTPAVILGVYSREEMGAIVEEPAFTGPTLDAEAEPAPAPSVESASDKKWHAWLHRLRQATEDAIDRAAVVEIGGRQSVADALASAPDWVKDDIRAMLADAFGRMPEEAASAEPAEADDTWPGPKP